jgi:hypothetical protein
MAQEIKIFRPTLVEENPLPLGSEELSYAPKLLQAATGGMIKVKLEEDVIIQRVSKDLYANPRSGFREFYNNECRACRTASRLYGAKPTIEIAINPSQRKLVIQGVDSLGMSQDKFLQVYSVLGRSDNFDGSEVGMFGLGRAAYTTLTDTMILETYSREDNSRYAVMGKSGVAYNLLPQPDLDSYGTRVTFVLDEKISIPELLEYIVDCTAFSGVETFLNLEESIDLQSWYSSDIPREKGRHNLGPKKFEERLEQTVRKTSTWHSVVSYFPVQIADEDFDLYAAFVARKDYDDLKVTSESSDEKEVRLLGAPVEARIELPFSAWILNLKDERKYPPTADRERLTDQSIKAILQRVESRIPEAIKQVFVSSINEYNDSQFKEVLKGFHALGMEKYLPPETLDVCRFISLEVKCYGEKEKKSLSELLPARGGLFYLPTLNGHKVAMIRSVDPEATVFRFARNNSDETPIEELLELVQRHGVRLADEFLRENKPVLKRQEVPMGDVAVHSTGTAYFSWGRFETVRRHVARAEPEALDDTTIRMPKGKIQPYLYLLSTFETRYRMVKDDRRLTRGVPLLEFVERLGTKRVLTNKGRIDFNRVAALGGKPHLLLYSDPAISGYFSERDDLMVFGDADLLFELAVFLTHRGAQFHTGFSGYDEFKRFGEPRKLYAYEFVHDADYEKLGDSEILYSVIHAVNAVKDGRLRELFLNAARWSKSAEEVAKMRKDVFSLDRQISD